jgi:O-antigen/teichoic acid export membrane protein
MAAIIAELGLGTIAIRELAAKRVGPERILPAVIVIRIGMGLIAILVATVAANALNYDRELIGLTASFALTFIIRGVGAGTFGLLPMATLTTYRSMIADTLDALSYLGIVAIGVATNRSLDWFILGGLASALINSLTIFALTRHLSALDWRIDARYCLTLLRDAIPLAIAGIFGVLYFRIDAVMLSKLGDSAAVGIYSTAYKFVDSAGLIGTTFTSSFFPVFSYYFDRDKTTLVYYYRKAIEILAVAGLSLGLTIFVLADSLILLLNGSAYADSIGVLRICSAAIAVMFVNNVGVHLLFAARQQRQLVWINLLGVAAKIGVNFVAIPVYGPSGAAAATVLTELVIGVAIFATAAKHQRLPSALAPIGKLVLVALAAIAILEITQPLLWQRVAMLLAWAAFLIMVGMPRPRDVADLLLNRGRG